MTDLQPPRGGVVDASAESDLPVRAFDDLGPRAPVIIETPASDPAALPNPETVFQFIERGWRPMLGVVCGAGFFYSFVAAPLTERREVDEAKLWVLCTLALGLAGVKTVERNRIGTPAGLLAGGPAAAYR